MRNSELTLDAVYKKQEQRREAKPRQARARRGSPGCGFDYKSAVGIGSLIIPLLRCDPCAFLQIAYFLVTKD